MVGYTMITYGVCDALLSVTFSPVVKVYLKLLFKVLDFSIVNIFDF